MATRVWQNLLTDEQRQRLGNELANAYRDKKTIPMWMDLHDVSIEHAVVQLAFELDFLTYAKYLRLTRELGLPLSAPDIAAQDRPFWTRDEGKLKFAGKVIRKVRIMRTRSSVQIILDAFQKLDWPKTIPSPLGCSEAELHEKVRTLNSSLDAIRFHVQKGGKEIGWDLKPQSIPRQPR